MKKLGFGLMRLPLTAPGDSTCIDMDQVCRMTDMFMAHGFNYFDTAWVYHNTESENAVKTFLVDRYPRESFRLTTKLWPHDLKCREDVDRLFEMQLEKTGAGYFDYYLLHNCNTNSLAIFEKYDCFEWLKKQKELGRVKHIGFSCHDSAAFLDRVLTEHPEMEVVQLQINYLDWDNDSVESRKCYDTAVRHGKKVIVMEPVKGGTLVNLPADVEKIFRDYAPERSLASWALRFAASRENVIMVLSGMSNIGQMEDNIKTMDDFEPLSAEEEELILKVVAAMKDRIEIPCTGCAYCKPECPMNIAIPEYFAIYNTEKQESEEKLAAWSPQLDYYSIQKKRSGAPLDCIECGHCEEMCPQHLQVREMLKTVGSYFKERYNL